MIHCQEIFGAGDNAGFGGDHYWTGSLLRSELAPMEDKSRLMVSSTAPEGTSYEAMYDYMSKILAVVDTLPEKDVIVSVTGMGGVA